MPSLSLQTVTEGTLQLEPRARVALLKDLREHARIKAQIKALEAKAVMMVERIESVRDEAGVDAFEIDGFKVAIVAPVRDVLDKQKLVALGCKVEWLTKATEQVPSKPYTKVTAPK
jgi:hypothetical protein